MCTCDICQKLNKSKYGNIATLQSLPIIVNAFDRIAIDVVGSYPLCNKSGNRWLLTVMDLCTHFFEAILIPEHKAPIVCRVLTDVFASFGFPKEILTDRVAYSCQSDAAFFRSMCNQTH